MSTAYWLSHLGLHPVVLERGNLSCGATGRNGGHFVFRIIFGGMRWQSPTKEIGIEDDSTLESSVGKGLKTFLRDRFPSLRDVAIDYEWTGIMGFTADENPLIGELPDRPGEYISAGYTGHGMPVAIAAGKAIAEQIAGLAQAPIPKPFRPERFLLG